MLKLIAPLISLFNSIVNYFRERRLIEFGKQEAELEGRKEIDEIIADVDTARHDDSVRVRTRQKYTRH